jgi:hypothetical protein
MTNGSQNNNKPTKSFKDNAMAIIAAIIVAIFFFATCGDSGSGGKQSAKEKYGMDYYERSDGKRIWYYTN